MDRELLTIGLSSGKELPLCAAQVEAGSTLKELVDRYQPQLPHRILAARVNGFLCTLEETITEPCSVQLLDLRDSAVYVMYQGALCLIYMKAARDILGDVDIRVENSLSQGLYTEIRGKALVTPLQVLRVEKRMKELAHADLPIQRLVCTPEEATALLKQGKAVDTALPDFSQASVVYLSKLDDFVDFFYSPMFPSTGYVEHFGLQQYRDGVLLRYAKSRTPEEIPPYVEDKKLYMALRESQDWCRLMKIDTVADLNKTVENGRARQIIQISEALHEKNIAAIADQIVRHKKRVVLIAGPSSSGKTTFTQRLGIQLSVLGRDPISLGMDDFFKEREDTPLDKDGNPDFEGVDALDIPLFNRCLKGLLAGETVDLPSFDFKTGHKIFGKRFLKLAEDQMILIEGIHGLNEALTAEVPANEKFKVYISPFTQINLDAHNRISTTDARLLRRMVRDSQFRGYDAAHTLNQWGSVRAGEEKNIFPFCGEADVFFNSVHIFELATLKKYAEPLLEKVTPGDECYSKAKQLKQFLALFRSIEDDSTIANNSILREFIGGSIFDV